MTWVRRNWPILLVILFPLIPLWRAAFLGEAIGPFDQIRQMAPWNEPAPDRPWDVLQVDGALQFYAWRDLVFEAWGKGELPFWNPYQLAGTPLLANSQSGGFYPPHVLMGILHVPTKTAMMLLAWFHLAWAGLGLMALARRMGATSEGAAFGGLLFAGSAFMIAWTGLPSVISTCAWIPWVLASIYGLFECRNGRRWAGKAAMLAFSVGMMVLAGHLQFAFYGLLAAGALVLMSAAASHFRTPEAAAEAESTEPRRLRRLRKPSENATADSASTPPAKTPLRAILVTSAIAMAAIGVGLGLAAPQLMPVLEYSKQSHRRNVASAEGYEAYVAGGIAAFELIGLVHPTAVGAPYAFAPSDKPLSQYWPTLVKRGSNFAEGAIGFGPIALLGLLLFPWRRRSWTTWGPIAAISIFALLVALGTPVNRLLYFGIPGWSSTGSPGRMGVLFVMGIAAMAAVGLSRTSWGEVKSSRWSIAAFGVAGGVLATVFGMIVLSGSLSPRFTEMDPGVIKRLLSLSISSSMFLAVVAILFVAIGYAAMRSRPGSAFRASVYVFSTVGVLAALSYVPFLVAFIPTSPTTYSRTSEMDVPALGRMTGINEAWELILAAPAVLPPNTASALRIHDLAGYDSLLDRQTHEFLGLVNGQDPAPPANGNMQFIKPTADPARLAQAGITYVLSRNPVFPKLKPLETESGLLRYKLEGPGRAYTYAGPAQVQDGFDRQTVNAIGPGQLTIKDRNLPGWKAFLNGKEQAIEPGMWRVVQLPEGEHRVDFTYEPPGLKTGLWIFVPCFLLTAGCFMFGRRR